MREAEIGKIKASELRIGNKFIGAGGVQTVKAIETYNPEQPGYEHLILVEESRSQFKPVDMAPIALTPEILEKAGLIKSNEFDMWYGFDHRLCIEKIHGGWLWCIDDTGNNEGSIQRPLAYAHQFQNIVFFVFNKELQIKL